MIINNIWYISLQPKALYKMMSKNTSKRIEEFVSKRMDMSVDDLINDIKDKIPSAGRIPDKGIRMIIAKTRIKTIPKVQSKQMKNVSSPKRSPSLNMFYGIDEIIRNIRRQFIKPLINLTILRERNIEPEMGLLLSGFPGTGKTEIALAIADELGAHKIWVNAAEWKTSVVGGKADTIIGIVDDANKKAGESGISIIIIDEIDAIASDRSDNKMSESATSNITALLAIFDKIHKSKYRVGVVGTTNYPNKIDSAFVRTGRMGIHISVPLPDEEGRTLIIGGVFDKINMPVSSKIPPDNVLSRKMAGFTPSDIISMINIAATNSIIAGYDFITSGAMSNARQQIKPIILREGFITTRETWDSIGGMTEIRDEIRRRILWPREYPDLYKKMGVPSPKPNILMYGPPGVGKTLVAKALANEEGFNFLPVSASDIMSKWVGASESNVRDIFEKAARAKPTIIFLDEADSLLSNRQNTTDTNLARSNVVNMFLEHMDGLRTDSGIILIAATNLIENIDPAFLRHGRFHPIKVELPSENARRAIIENKIASVPNDVDVDELVERTSGMSGADIVGMIEIASLRAIEEAIKHNESPILRNI
jgi:transitional endoplasmic reticulum ATPase